LASLVLRMNMVSVFQAMGHMGSCSGGREEGVKRMKCMVQTHTNRADLIVDIVERSTFYFKEGLLHSSQNFPE
jgi:hypothetical protein